VQNPKTRAIGVDCKDSADACTPAELPRAIQGSTGAGIGGDENIVSARDEAIVTRRSSAAAAVTGQPAARSQPISAGR
jgi:hypothetical protein